MSIPIDRDSGHSPSASAGPLAGAAALLPGLMLAALIAAAALALRSLPGLGALSPMVIALFIGAAIHNTVGAPAVARPGIRFAMRSLLRAAIVLLGLQLTLADIASVGPSGLAVIVLAVAGTFAFTMALARFLAVDHRLAELIGAGTAICGASAIVATNGVTRASESDVAYALACITLFGTLAIVAYPLIGEALGLDATAYGVWAGASIHEVAQVVAAAFQGGEAAGEAGVVTKLTRVLLLAPLVLALGFAAARRARAAAGAGANIPAPWFVLGFAAMVALNSAVAIPEPVRDGAAMLTGFLFAAALAALGLETSVAEIRAKGVRPLLLGLAATLFIAGFSLLLIVAFGLSGTSAG